MFQLLKSTSLKIILLLITMTLSILWLSKNHSTASATEETTAAFPTTPTVSLSADGHLGLFVPESSNPQLWDLSSHRPLFSLVQNKEASQRISQIVFSQNNRYVATIYGNSFGIWDLQERKEKYYYALPQRITQFCLNNDGDKAVITLKNNSLQTINLATQQTISKYNATSDITGLSCNQNSSLALIGLTDNMTQLWDTTTGEIHHTWRFKQSATHVLLSPQGNRALIVAGPYEAHVWDTGTYEPLMSLHQRNKHLKLTYKELLMITTADFSPEGQFLVFGTPSGSLQLWDIERKHRIKKWSFKRNRSWPPRANYAISASINPSSNQIITISSLGEVNFWKN